MFLHFWEDITMTDNSLIGLDFKKYSGVLLHPTSLPGPYGIGELGRQAYDFIDFLVRSGMNTWQTLPLGHTGFGDSPYQPFSAFAGQPLIISLDHLKELGLLYDNDFCDMPKWNPEIISYGDLIEFKTGLLKLAYERFLDENHQDRFKQDSELMEGYKSFCETSAGWLDDYALFMAGKDFHNGEPWYMWNDSLKKPTKRNKTTWKKKLEKEMGYYKFI
jgi:4-alpha-glucanotransferase